MNYFRILVSLWVSVAVYTISSIFFGATGIFAMQYLSAERDRLAENLSHLREINVELNGSLDALRYDKDTLALYARDLGYGKDDERFIRIVDLHQVSGNHQKAGEMLIPKRLKTLSEDLLRAISLLTGLSVYIGLSLSALKGKKSRYRRSATING
jgi:cell division protein FtsB